MKDHYIYEVIRRSYCFEDEVDITMFMTKSYDLAIRFCNKYNHPSEETLKVMKDKMIIPDPDINIFMIKKHEIMMFDKEVADDIIVHGIRSEEIGTFTIQDYGEKYDNMDLKV